MRSVGSVLGRSLREGGLLWALTSVGLLLAFAATPAVQHAYDFEYRPIAHNAREASVASLALARGEADALEVSIPCVEESSFRSVPPNPISGALEYRPPDIGVELSVEQSVASLRVGGSDVLSADITDPHNTDCVVGAEFNGKSWVLKSGDVAESTGGPSPRIVEAAFSGPAATSELSFVRVTTRELGSSPGPWRLLLYLSAVAAACGGAWQLARSSRTSVARTKWSRIRLPRLKAVDWLVISALVGLIAVVPPTSDDAWIRETARAYGSHGDFSTLFNVRAVTEPFLYAWHWLNGVWYGLVGDVVVWWRLPRLVLGLGSWSVARWAGNRLGLKDRSPGVWVMAAVFIVGFGAWGFSLRPEPLLMLVVISSAALAIRFQLGERGWVVVAWALVLSMAVVHPSGIVAWAPVVASWRSILAWLRSGRTARIHALTASLITMSAAIAVVLVDSNLTLELEAIRTYAQSEVHQYGVLDEWLRYRHLETAGTTLHRTAFVLLAAGAVFSIRPAPGLTPTQRTWVRSLGLGFVMLALVPSKWLGHFGVLVALGALALAIEIDNGGKARRIIMGIGLALGMAWAWATSVGWTPLDLRTQEWWRGASNLSPVDLSTAQVWVGIFALISLGMSLLRWKWPMGQLSSVHLLVLCSVLIAGGIFSSTLALDVVRTDGWSFGRQSLQGLVASAGCGLGDEILIPQRHSLTQLTRSDDPGDRAADAVTEDERFEATARFEQLHEPPLNGFADEGWISAPEGEASFVSDWYDVDGFDAIALMVQGDLSSGRGAVALQWGEVSAGWVRDKGVELLGEEDGISPYRSDWTLLATLRPPDADRVRLVADHGEGSSSLSSSPPLGFSTVTPSRSARAAGSRILMDTRLGSYFPCIEAPQLTRAVAPVPEVIVNNGAALWQTTYLSAASSETYFEFQIRVPPNGHHEGLRALLSHEYLVGQPARITGEFLTAGRN